MSTQLTSVSGFLTLLDEPELRVYALEKLNQFVDDFWAEIAFSVHKLILLAEDERFSAHELASLVVAKVYYHLGEFDRAMQHALGAGRQFDMFGKKTEFFETLVAKFVDEYIKLRLKMFEQADPSKKPKIDERLERIVMNMFDRCYQEGDFKPALGIALEARRTDKLRESITRSADVPGMLAYAFKVVMTLVSSRDFRLEVLRILVEIHLQQKEPDYVAVVQCLVFLDDAQQVANLLRKLLQGDTDAVLLAYQIAFDLFDNASQQFRKIVRELIPAPEGGVPSSAAAADSSKDSKSTDKDQEKEKEPADAMHVDRPAGSAATTAAAASSSSQASEYAVRYGHLQRILSGEVPILLSLEFLYRNNHADMAVLKQIKTAVEARNSVAHSATIFANALMHAGTTRDTFLRENLEWLVRATNWAKFSATAALGVIHKGHIKEGLTLLSPYLPAAGGGGGAAASPFSEGGALYGLGLIHANHGAEISKYLLTALRTANENALANEVLLHGACLGLGVAAMATRSEEIYEALKTALFNDSAVIGEAAGLAMGLVMLGSASSQAIGDMLAFAHETQHEKIIRGLALGIALLMYGRQEHADTLIEQLQLDTDPILRYGGMYAVGMAYAGTASESATRRLLHVAVSDVSDDVRRAAVLNLGFVLFRQPKETPRMVSLLAASYNPHVRYGAALAVGISCAGSALKEAIEVLEPLTTDVVDFVRQGALIGLALVLMQVTKAQEPKVEAFRNSLQERIADKHEETLAKFGAVLACGLLDAGGRNVTVALASRSGHASMSAIVGMAVFTQFWYWFPLLHFCALAFTPTAIVGLNKDLKMPLFQFRSNARPSLFAYPPALKPKETTAPTKAAPAVLSTAAKAKQRKKEDAMEVTPSSTSAPSGPIASASTSTVKKEDDTKKDTKTTAHDEKDDTKKDDSKKDDIKKDDSKKDDSKKEAEEPAKPEPSTSVLQNPARVTPLQLKHIAFDVDARYVPVKRHDNWGVVMLRDTRPNEPEQFVGAPTPVPAAVPTPPSPAPAAANATQAASTSSTAPSAGSAAPASGGGGGGSAGGKEPDAPPAFEFDG